MRRRGLGRIWRSGLLCSRLRRRILRLDVPEADLLRLRQARARHVGQWAEHKPGGGAVYINEARELFGPRGEDDYIYLGYMPLDEWFPRPAVEDEDS